MNESYEVRPIEGDDVERLRRLFYRLSTETVYRRFFQPIHSPSDSALHFLCDVDHVRRDALVAVSDDGEVRAVGPGDAILIPPGSWHTIRATGDGPVRLLCGCAPPWSADDTYFQ